MLKKNMQFTFANFQQTSRNDDILTIQKLVELQSEHVIIIIIIIMFIAHNYKESSYAERRTDTEAQRLNVLVLVL